MTQAELAEILERVLCGEIEVLEMPTGAHLYEDPIEDMERFFRTPDGRLFAVLRKEKK